MKFNANNKSTFLTLIVVIIFLSLIVIQIFYFYETKKIIQIREFEMNVQVLDYIGFNNDINSLNFGTLKQNGQSSREIIINSNESVFTTIKFKGDMAKWTEVSKNNFILIGEENLVFSVRIPNDAEFKNYTGKATIVFKKI